MLQAVRLAGLSGSSHGAVQSFISKGKKRICGMGHRVFDVFGIVAIGSGGAYAQSAARALLENTALSPLEIVTKSLTIAGELCIYTNTNFTLETLE